MSKTTLAEKIGVDLRTISSYESGTHEPKPENLERLCFALRVSSEFFFKSETNLPEASQASFRSLSKMSATKRDLALANGGIAFEISKIFEEEFNLPKAEIPDLSGLNDPEESANQLRLMWGIGERPVSNMIHLMESKGVRVFSLSIESNDVDAFCTWNENIPFVFLNTKKSSARSRFDAAHELAHLALHRHGDYDGRVTEREADEFASAFLMPRSSILATAPRFVDLKSAIEQKAKWGVSLAAYVVRLHKLGLISDWHYRTLFKQIGQKGYLKREPNDPPREKSKLISLILDELRSEGKSIRHIAENIGFQEGDIAELMFDLALFGQNHIDGSKIASKNRATHLKLIIDNSR